MSDAPFTLHEAQKVIALDPHRFRVVCCGRRFGKALDVETPILTTKGFKKLQDVLVGDFVFGEDGNPYEVTYKSPVYTDRTCYKVIFSDGSEVIADAEHDWVVESKAYRKNITRTPHTKLQPEKKTTEEIKDSLYITRTDGKREHNWSIQTTQPLVTSYINLPIEPYFLGLWLGDGSSTDTGITTVDNEVIQYLYEYADRRGVRVNKRFRESTGVSTYAIVGGSSQKERNTSLQKELRDLGVLNNKHIPQEYLLAGYTDRLNLLKGLMDSDGYCQNGFYEYTSIKKKLATSVYQLLMTFGIKATINEYDSFFDGRLIGKKYRINFSTDLDVFNLERKREKQKTNRKSDIKRRFIVAVEKIKSRPVQCLRINSPSHLFLAGHSLIPTHNTQLAIDQMKARAAIPNSRVAYIATCYDDQTEILTNKGWKFFKDLDKTELVGTYSDGGLVFEKPKEYFIHDYEGEMCGIQNGTIDQLVTPHHRCLVKNHRKGGWHIKTAEEIENTWVYRFKKTPDVDARLSFPKDEDTARFWGWYISEGYSRKRTSSKSAYEVIITQCKEEYITEIRELLLRLEYQFTEQKRQNGGVNFSLCGDKLLYTEAQKYGKSHKKFVPDWIKNSPPGIIRAFLDAYWKGDGHFPKNAYDYKRAETKSKRLADELQECIIKIGESATVRPIKGRPLWSVSWLHEKFNAPLIRRPDYYRIPYKGKVYCVRVSSGILMVRRNGKHYFSGNTYQQARDICWMQLRKECEQAAETINESRLEIRLINGSTIVLRGWENIETLRGQKFDLLVLDEVASMRNYWEMWHEVIRPTLTDSKGEGIFIGTPKGFNHFYDLFNLESSDKDYKSFHFTTYDNPHIDKEEVDKAKQELTEDRFAQEYLADFRKTEGLVYKEFDRKVHVIKGDLDDWYKEQGESKVRTYGGVDFGFVHPCAVLPIDETSDGKFVVYNEWYHTGKTDDEIAEYVAAQKFNYVFPDPANAGGIKSLKDHGCNIRDVIKGKDSVKNGINIVRELFKSGRLFIHESCPSLILELETYSYGENSNGGKVDENPVKEHDDACFAEGTMVNGRRIEEIGVTTGTADVYEYTVAGEKLQATPNHPMMTHRGVVHIDALRYDDVIWKQKKLLFMTTSNGLDIQTLVNGVTGITTLVLKTLREARERDCTDIYGVSITGKSPKGIMSTILMVTPLIMKYLTLLALTAGNTLLNIILKKSVSGLDKILGKLFWLLPNGARQMLAKNVVGKWVFKTHISCWSVFQSLNNATFVEKPTLQKAMGEIDSATLTVGKKRYVGHVPVYNLKTKSGMYHANGILVHNCDALRYVLMMVHSQKAYNRPKIFRPRYVGFNARG